MQDSKAIHKTVASDFGSVLELEVVPIAFGLEKNKDLNLGKHGCCAAVVHLKDSLRQSFDILIAGRNSMRV